MNPDDYHNNNMESVRAKEFPALIDVIYLDHAGTTLPARSQLEAHYRDISENIYGNPHSRSPSSQLTTDTIDQVRYRILNYFNTSPEEYSVIFTSGCTGALKLVAESFNFIGPCCSNSPNYHGNRLLNVKLKTSNFKVISETHDFFGTKGHVDGTEQNENIDDHLINSKCDCSCHDSKSSGCCGNQSGEKHKRGSFVYLLDNHTSVQGMREIAFARAGRVSCMDSDNCSVISAEHILYEDEHYQSGGNCLFAFPAQSNFSGQKYPMKWISEAQGGQLGDVTLGEGRCYVLLDAACHVSTSPLDLGCYKPDFVTLSFYKMFGFPTGLGALLVLNKSGHLLRKTYYGGGTVAVSLSTQRFHVLRPSLAERFEDGTVSFLDIIALRHGFEALNSLAGGIFSISKHTFSIAKHFYKNLKSLQHSNGRALVDIYCHGNFEDPNSQGPLITFNCIRANGEYVGFSEVDKLAQLQNIHFRTGCFCNLGACQKFLNISDDELKNNFDAGHVCGDDKDLINGKPTGAIRVSFGYMSTLQDANTCLQFLVDCFLENPEKPVFIEKLLEDQSALANGYIVNQSRDLKLEVDSSDNSLVSVKETVNELAACRNFRSLKSEENSAYKSITKDSEAEEAISDLPNHDQLSLPSKIVSNATRDESKVEASAPTKDSDQTTLNKKILDLRTDQIKDQESAIFVDDYTPKSASNFDRTLTHIFVYPVKSCAAVKVQKWPLSDRGLLYDREWMIVTESGVTLSLKRETKLCLLQPSIDLDLQILILHYPEMEPVSVPLTYEEKDMLETSLCSGKVCGDRVQSIDCGQEVSDWLSNVLGRPGCRLIRQKADDQRRSKLKQNGGPDMSAKLNLANESQYLLLNSSTLDLLKATLMERYENGETTELIDFENLLHRFRSNLVVDGGSPFDEEMWQSLQIGDIRFKCQGSCTRCQMICFDPLTGEKSKEPLKTLAVWRQRKMIFGVYLCCTEDFSSGRKTIKVGDCVIPS